MLNVELMMVVGVVRMILRATMYSLKALVSLSTTFNSSSMAAWSGGMTFLKNKSSIKIQKKEILFVKSDNSEKSESE